jgi:hypothetical protein
MRVIGLTAGLLCCLACHGQTKSDPHPRTGFHPSGIYNISDIETLSHTNGNLMFNLPLGSLGPDRRVTHGELR